MVLAGNILQRYKFYLINICFLSDNDKISIKKCDIYRVLQKKSSGQLPLFLKTFVLMVCKYKIYNSLIQYNLFKKSVLKLYLRGKSLYCKTIVLESAEIVLI